MCVRDLAARCARGLRLFRALENRGRRESRVRAAPAVSGASCTRKCAHEHTGPAEASRLSLREGFTISFELYPVTGFVASIACESIHKLDATTVPSCPHD